MSFILKLWYQHHSYCGDNAWNTDFFQNTGFKESTKMAFNNISE